MAVVQDARGRQLLQGTSSAGVAKKEKVEHIVDVSVRVDCSCFCWSSPPALIAAFLLHSSVMALCLEKVSTSVIIRLGRWTMVKQHLNS